MGALAENIKKFETQFGVIDDQDHMQYLKMNFNTPKAQA
jgi:hypothetical protein